MYPLYLNACLSMIPRFLLIEVSTFNINLKIFIFFINILISMSFREEVINMIKKFWSIIKALLTLGMIVALIIQLNLSRIEILQVLTLTGILFLGIITWSDFKTTESLLKDLIEMYQKWFNLMELEKRRKKK